ncbi:MAG: SH3 domain-containing protein [Gammaproteobacteria bacterium]|nr:SH3 domain-containing protein [Gammaproteobacteria bacterium]MBU1408923.1 SH3 domain-containing protein [Gammaproteobacteria bacterium]MBU1533656.1 SH3 domain-containing protein [Gammaproteobacteria bacterium]
MKAIARALVMGLFLTQAITPVHANPFGFTLGGDPEAGQPSGSAGPDGAQGEAKELEKCDKSYGTLAVVEPQDAVVSHLLQYGLQSPTGLIRMMVQQSNCFVLVERGRAMQNLMQERQLAESGELRRGSNMGKGQMVTADYVLTPDAVFSSKDSGGIGGLGGFGMFGAVAGLVAAGLKFKSAQTTMILSDSRTSLQLASATGNAEKTDWSVGGLLVGGGGAGALGGYTNTPEGKVIAASYLDNWNNIVRSVRNNPEMARQDIDLKGKSGQPTKAGAVFEEGDAVTGKIAGLKIYAQPKKTSKVVAKIARGEEVIYTGKDEGGFMHVQGQDGEGWVEKIMMKK